MSTAPLRVGVIGAGMIGTDHAHRIAGRVANADLVGIADADADRAQQLGRELAVPALDDPLALIHDPGVDAVVIASPGWVHEDQVLACLESGTYALCEKPLTMESAASRRLVEAERDAGPPRIQVGFMRRFDPDYVAMKHMIDRDEMGRLLLVHNVHRAPQVPATFRSEMIVRDSLVHEVDTCRWLFGEEITEITVHSPAATSRAAEGVVDPQVAVFRMAGGGMATTEVFVNSAAGYEVRCEATMETGNATVGLGDGVFVRHAGRWGGGIPDDFRVRFAAAFDREVQAWVDASRRGEVAGPGTGDGHAATTVCEAGMESLRTGLPVTVALEGVPT